jgi:hypothetical protein
MLGSAKSWPHQVEIKLDGHHFASKLRDLETWLQGWEIPYQVRTTFPAGTLRICFAEIKFADAFRMTYGGKLMPEDEVEAAMRADLADEEEYRRRADKRRR